MHCRRTIVALVAIVLYSAISADQITVLDRTYTHSRWYYHFEMPTQPSNWLSPRNYAEGAAYLRCEVFSIQNLEQNGGTFLCAQDSPTNLVDGGCTLFAPHVCFFQDRHSSDNHCCQPLSTMISFNKPGVYYNRFRMNTMDNYGFADWSREMMDIMIIAKALNPYARIYEGHDVHMRFEVIVVEQNGSFSPPSHWTGMPSGWGFTSSATPPRPGMAQSFCAPGPDRAYTIDGRCIRWQDVARARSRSRHTPSPASGMLVVDDRTTGGTPTLTVVAP